MKGNLEKKQNIASYQGQKGRGTYCFWCGSRQRMLMRRRDTFLCARYLMNYWVDSNQICLDITFGQDEELSRFW